MRVSEIVAATCDELLARWEETTDDRERTVLRSYGEALLAILSRVPAPTAREGRARERPRARIVAPTSRIERARLWLARVDPAISGSGGHRATFRAAVGLVRGFELDEETALYLLETEYSPRCKPPWPRSALVHKVRDASRARVAPGWLLDAPRRSA